MDETEIDLRAIFGVLQRQFRLIVATTITLLAIAGVAVFVMTPMFSATALVLYDPSNKNLLDPERQMSSSSSDSARIDSEVELMRSDNMLLQTIRRENLITDPEFAPKAGLRNQILAFLRLSQNAEPSGEDALNSTITKLRNAITIQRRGLTYLIAISAKSESPTRAAEIANSLVDAYITDQLNSKVASVLNSRAILDGYITEARSNIVESEGSFDSFVDSNLAQIISDTGRVDLATTQAQIRELEAARAQKASLVTRLEADLNASQWDNLVASLQSEALNELDRQRQEIDRAIAENSDPTSLSNFRAQLAEIDERLRVAAASEVSELRNSLTLDQDRQTAMRQDLRARVLGSGLSPDMLTQLYELQQTADLARTQYQTLLSRAQDLTTQASLQVPDSRLVSLALPPSSPASPNTRLILILAALAGLGLGVGLAFVYENLIGGFMTEEQLESVLRVRNGAVVPRERGKTEKDSLADLLVEAPLSMFSESIRRLRASADMSLRGKMAGDTGGSVIMVTSTAPNEGKTTTALALARSYSLSGRTTLLIDCDLRKPSVHRQLKIASSLGLLELLHQKDREIDVSSVIAKDPLTELTVIVGARRSDIPTDQVLASTSFANLIEAARNAYDVVILDTPPVGPVVDALYVAPISHIVLFATKWASTSQRDVRSAVNALEAAAGKDLNLLTVLTHQNETSTAYKRKYGAYYAATA